MRPLQDDVTLFPVCNSACIPGAGRMRTLFIDQRLLIPLIRCRAAAHAACRVRNGVSRYDRMPGADGDPRMELKAPLIQLNPAALLCTE